MKKPSKKKSIIPTVAEEAQINRGISMDPDNPELTEDDFRRMRPASEFPEIMAAVRRGRGPNKAPTKEVVNLRLSHEILEFFRGSGRGWQTRINEALLRVVRRKAKA